MPAVETHHYWLPVPDRTGFAWKRHAFRSRRWGGRTADTSVCNVQCPMARPSELDWFQDPTSQDCTSILLDEQTP
ncbi:hypothetical protein FHR84_003156 [Actinopolyspora biskrensis]|uniref:Uncharacterized protein n=1 Tax=Actinopolyspora biskrensis TaxID=1470178 RepID=A0A852Z032_9ACTN|nr:hypothetical protein [Actinopolyspora biskrensis]NYH79818.1 hypothetical protein [Actinopolyspora biskrensis]